MTLYYAFIHLAQNWESSMAYSSIDLARKEHGVNRLNGGNGHSQALEYPPIRNDWSPDCDFLELHFRLSFVPRKPTFGWGWRVKPQQYIRTMGIITGIRAEGPLTQGIPRYLWLIPLSLTIRGRPVELLFDLEHPSNVQRPAFAMVYRIGPFGSYKLASREAHCEIF